MKILKISGILIVVLLSIVGFKAFTLSGINLNPSKTSSNGSSDLSAGISRSEVKPNNGGNPSDVSTSEILKYETAPKTLDTSSPASDVLDLNNSVLSCHVDSDDVDAQTGATSKASIYGNNLSVIPTQVLIKKASVSGKNQNAEFMGIGIDFLPLIIVTGSNKDTKIKLDFTGFNDAEGKYNIVNTATNVEVASFSGKKDVQEIQFSAQKSGGYSIIKDKYTLGVIEVVDSLDSADLEQVRKKYIK